MLEAQLQMDLQDEVSLLIANDARHNIAIVHKRINSIFFILVDLYLGTRFEL